MKNVNLKNCNPRQVLKLFPGFKTYRRIGFLAIR
jgi:hypothetical protein